MSELCLVDIDVPWSREARIVLGIEIGLALATPNIVRLGSVMISSY